MSSYYLFDALGSVERLIDPSEDNLVIYVNTAFGGPRYESTAAENNFRWVGRLGYYYDATLYAAYYVRARYYDYFTARWLSEDMVRAIEDQLNLYLYSSNNPILDTDPSGLKPQWQLDCEGCFTPKGTPPPSGIPKIGEPCYYPNRLVRAPNSIWYQSQCVCQCAGDSPNFNDVRACIKCADERGAPRNTIEAEEYCRHKVVYTENEQKRIDCCVNTDWNQGGCAIPFFLLNNAQNYLNPNPQAKSCTDLPIP